MTNHLDGRTVSGFQSRKTGAGRSLAVGNAFQRAHIVIRWIRWPDSTLPAIS